PPELGWRKGVDRRRNRARQPRSRSRLNGIVVMRAIAVGAALAGLIVGAVAPAAGQRSLGDRCDNGVITAAGARDACLAAAQAAVSAQPVVGLLMAGGSPTTGSAVGGLRLGVVPRVSTGARLNL